MRTVAVCTLAALGILQVGCTSGSGEFIQGGFGNSSSGSGGTPGQQTTPPAGVRVTISPTAASVAPGNQLKLTATVQNATDMTVSWSVNGIRGGNQTVGTISTNGNYTAPTVPPVPDTVMITATSNQDPTKSATALVVVTQPSTQVTVSASPASITLQTGASTVFAAVVMGTANTAVTWRVNGIAGGDAIVGTITAAGVYTAPANVPSPATVTIEAISVADPTASGTALVNIVQRVQVAVSPSSASVGTFLTQQFTPTVTGTTNTAVTWAVNGVVGGNATVGTIDASGLYTAPGTPPASSTVTISATSAADPTAVGFATVTIINSPGVTVTVTPGIATVDVNLTVLFTATVTGTFRGITPSGSVTWFANNLPGGSSTFGTIVTVPCPMPMSNTSCGLYTAPAGVPVPSTIPITAYSVTDPSSSGSALVSVTAPAAVTVSVSPGTANVQVGTTQQFTATVGGTANQGVTWSVNGIAGGNATVGTINAMGLYTAPAAVPAGGMVLVTATSVVDPNATGSASVTILAAPPPPSISIAPTMATLRVNDQLQFTPTISGTTATNVIWRVNNIIGGNATVGTIDTSGLYTAPGTVPAGGSVTVRGSVTDPATMTTVTSGPATITLLPLATITLSPQNPTVQAGLAVQFTATVTGHANLSVAFLVNNIVGGNSTVGTITVGGLYVAPTTAPASGNVTVTAVSNADPNLRTSTMVTIVQPVVVTVAPTTATVSLGGTQQFAATVTGNANTMVTWSVNGIAGGNATVGTISAAGLYTAPTNLLLTQPFTITATSVADPTASGNASVTVTVPVAVTVAPTAAMVQVGATQQFNATVTGTTNPNVTWSVNGIAGGNATVGTITASGLFTAPATVPGTNPVTVRATSVADPTKSAAAMVTITPGVAVSVSPATATVSPGGTQQFTATVTGTATTTVTWSVNGVVGGDLTVGTITAGGLYTAPSNLPNTQSFTITAVSTVDPTAMATAQVTVSVPINVTVSPSMQSVRVSTGQQFMASVSGTTNQAVLWSVGGACAPNCGTINMTTGLYVAPSTVPAGNVTVTASSVADPSRTGTATVTITAAIAVSVSPAMATVTTSAMQQFTATVTGTATTTVTWSVNGIAGGNATVGTINGAGLYTAPAAVPSPSTVTVRAASTVDPTATGSSMVTIVPPISVSVAPAAATVQVTQTQTFTATVTGSANQMVTWSLSGTGCGGSACGTITSTGVYTAPSTVPSPATVTVRATSVADPTKSGTATVTVAAAPPTPANVFVSVFPRGRLLPIGVTQQFTALVIRTPNQSVTWAVNGIVGGNATVGTIDSTGLYSPPNAQPANADITITATSVADPTKSMTVNARIIPRVVVTPESVKLRGGATPQTQQFTATVSGAANTAVVWAVNGVPGGNLNVGTITATGLYTPPSSLQPPGQFTVSATSVADANAVGVATVGQLVGAVRIIPASVTVMPGATYIFQPNVHFLPPASTPGPLLTWRVNGIIGGNATVGTISTAGVYTAPATPQMVTIEARSTVDATRFSTSSVNVAVPGGASPVGLVTTLEKIRAFDVLAGASSMTLPVAGNQYASFQVLVEGRAEDLTGVNVTVSDFVDGLGNRIPSSNATIYLERYVNVFYASRAQGAIGEWPDPLIPKVDPFVGETRNAFPFVVNRISPAYKRYPRTGGETTSTNLGAGRVTPSGVYAGMRVKHYLIRIDQSGSVGSARFRWSDDGGATFQQTNLATSATQVPLNDGVTVSFQAGGVTGVTDFVAGDEFWIFAGPNRNQPVWVDVFVPGSVPPGMYTGTATVVRAGKANVTLNLTLDVKAHVLPVTSSIPAFVGMNWANLIQAHFQTSSGPQTLSLGHLYGVACLINRISCDTASVFPPTFTFNVDGSVATSNYASYDQATAPLANGTLAPHGEQLSAIRLPRAGVTTSEQFFAAENMLMALGTRGWRARAFDFSFDEPGATSDFRTAMTRASIVRTVDSTFRSLVTTDISQFGGNLRGYVNRWSPDVTSLEQKEFLDGPNDASRSFYEEAIAGGDELWWYLGCRSHDCAGTGTTPRHDMYPALVIDLPAIQNRAWGQLAASPYRVQGVLLQDSVLAYTRFFNMPPFRVDVWQSTYYNGGNGEGTLFYPGRPADIGGTTHVPVESIRLKHLRDALVDMENVAFLRNRGAADGAFAEQQILNGLNLNAFTYNPDLAEFATRSTNILNQSAQPPLPPPIMVPAAGGCYIEPSTGNRVCRVTDRALCSRAGHHNYSYWPIWNATGTHLIVECNGWVGAPGSSSNALLIRDSDLVVIGDATPPGAGSTLELFWSAVDPNILYFSSGIRVLSFNPFTKAAPTVVADFTGTSAGGVNTGSVRLVHMSFDDRFVLVELNGAGGQFGLATFDRMAAPGSQIRTLSTRNLYSFFDESILTKGNRVWVIGNLISPPGFTSRSYAPDFNTFVTSADHGHHAHGMLPNGTPVGLKEEPNRVCPPGSLSGIPTSNWKPTALILNQTINVTNPAGDPLPSEILRLGCNVPGQHEFSHFSWNNTQGDRFFISSWGYSAPGTDPIANSVLRVRLQFDPLGNVIGDLFDIITPHRSEKRFGYFALPRASCNRQATRCIFSSTMTVGTNNTDTQEHLYVVDVP
jgi:hypothetical protein